MSASNKWQDVKCMDCGQYLTDPRNAVTQHDVKTGGLKGRHDVCPGEGPRAGRSPSADYQRGWDDCYACLLKASAEHFPIPAATEKS